MYFTNYVLSASTAQAAISNERQDYVVLLKMYLQIFLICCFGVWCEIIKNAMKLHVKVWKKWVWSVKANFILLFLVGQLFLSFLFLTADCATTRMLLMRVQAFPTTFVLHLTDMKQKFLEEKMLVVRCFSYNLFTNNSAPIWQLFPFLNHWGSVILPSFTFSFPLI